MKTLAMAITLLCAAVGRGQTQKQAAPSGCFAATFYPDGRKVCEEARAVKELEFNKSFSAWTSGTVSGTADTGGGCSCNDDGSFSCYAFGEGVPPPTGKPAMKCEVKPKPVPKPILGDETQGYSIIKPMELKPCALNAVNPPCLPITSQQANGVELHANDVLRWTASGVGMNVSGVSADSDGRVSVQSATGRIDRLSDEEYARLQATPMNDYEAEKRKVALAHGVVMETDSCHQMQFKGFAISCVEPATYPDQWEIRGQFLLVNVPQGVGR